MVDSMLIARSLSTLHHDTAPIHVCLPPRRTWPAVVFLMPTWAILKGFAYCLPYPKICLMPVMFAHISLTMYIGSVFIWCIVSTIFAKRNIHLRKYTPGSSDACMQLRLLLSGRHGPTAWVQKILYFTTKTTYSNRRFDLIDPNKWLI